MKCPHCDREIESHKKESEYVRLYPCRDTLDREGFEKWYMGLEEFQQEKDKAWDDLDPITFYLFSKPRIERKESKIEILRQNAIREGVDNDPFPPLCVRCVADIAREVDVEESNDTSYHMKCVGCGEGGAMYEIETDDEFPVGWEREQ